MKTGIIIKSTGSKYKLFAQDKLIYTCSLRGRFKNKNSRSTNPIAVGDKVAFTEGCEHTGVIEKIYPRKNSIIRRSTNLSKLSHTLAANIDSAALMLSLSSPRTYTEFIDRFIVSAESKNIKTVIVFNKIDLYNPEELAAMNSLTKVYRNIGYTVIHTSVKEKIGIQDFKNIIYEKTVLISGNSGVGKSSMLNLLKPELELKTSGVSDYHRAGKHTTTFAQMHMVGNSRLIDTPGIKAFGIIQIPDRFLSDFFIEIKALRENCKFNNCSHTHEPGCAVKKALEKGEIARFRYDNYLSILQDDDENTKYRPDIYR